SPEREASPQINGAGDGDGVYLTPESHTLLDCSGAIRAQHNLEILGSSDPPAAASQSAGMTVCQPPLPSSGSWEVNIVHSSNTCWAPSFQQALSFVLSQQ
uniref:Uncharacterized protein n=1 Tax=Prolemur simus TaxID=1328070 RepID=A0A8C8YRZ9_PROSS